MSNKKLYMTIALYNFINSFLFFFVGDFSTLNVFYDLKLSLQITIVIFCAIISAVLYFWFLVKNYLFLKISYSIFINTLLFIFFTILIYILYGFLKPYLPMVDLNSASGLWILMLFHIYLLVSWILKSGVLIYFKKRRKTQNKSDQSSDSSKPRPIKGRFYD